MLSHDEDRQLKAIEQWFEESDPAFTRMLRAHQPPERRRQRKAGLIALDLSGGLIFLIGAVVGTAVLMVFGVLVLGVAACLHLSPED